MSKEKKNRHDEHMTPAEAAEEALKEALGEGFIATHRAYLVNLAHVQRITKTDVILDDGSAVPLSRRLYDEVNRAYIAYYRKQ